MDMMNAAARVERLSRARRAQASFRASRPLTRRPFVSRLPAVSAPLPRFQSRFKQIGSTANEVNSLDTLIVPVGNVLNMTSAAVGSEPNVFAGITEINLVRQGNTFYQRSGNKIHMRSVSVMFTPYVATTNGVINMRWMIVYDKQPNGAFPALTDVLATNDAGTVTFQSGVNMANRSRFLVIRDRIETFNSALTTSVAIKDFARLNLDTEFKGNGGTIGDISTGSLLFLCFVDWYDASNKIGVSPASASPSITTRVRFDL